MRASPALVRIFNSSCGRFKSRVDHPEVFFLYYNVELVFRRYESGIHERIDFVFFDCYVGINITDVTEEKQSNC